MIMGGLTVKGTLPIGDKFSIYGEGGMAIITRIGFHEKDNEALRDAVKVANYESFMFGAGFNYHLNDNWTLKLSGVYSPENSKAKQHYIAHYAAGFSYTMREISDEKLARKANSDHLFPHQLLQVGFATNAFGYGVSDFFSEGEVPVFWGGSAQVQNGVTVQYQLNIFQGKKIFSLYLGSTFGYWKSQINQQEFITVSVFPLFRFNLLHTKHFDFYYSLARPSFISGIKIDDYETGPMFTFKDYMGIGFFVGQERKLNTKIRIAHYSNGNLFPQNEGVKIPLIFNVGYTF
jgi:hypothetical protein